MYNCCAGHQISKPPFNCTDNDGLPMLLRGVSNVTTTPELPTWPFHLDRPICHVQNRFRDRTTNYVHSETNYNLKKKSSRGIVLSQKLTERAVKADGCLEQDTPHITFSSSFNEWITSARTPGSLPPNVGHKL
jgi:hypothetical protein